MQTHTPVRRVVEYDGADFAVVHATNAWLGHLVPELRPHISPVRGNAVHYAALAETTPSTCNLLNQSPLGLDYRYPYWLSYGAKDYDYLVQCRDGAIVVGRANTGRQATADDNETDLEPMANLRGFSDEAAARPLYLAEPPRPTSHTPRRGCPLWASYLVGSISGSPAGITPWSKRFSRSKIQLGSTQVRVFWQRCG